MISSGVSSRILSTSASLIDDNAMRSVLVRTRSLLRMACLRSVSRSDLVTITDVLSLRC